MKTPSWYVSRRALLRGTGVGIALPFLEVMNAGKRARAAVDAKLQPRRFIGIQGLPVGGAAKPQQAYYADRIQGCVVPEWTPAAPDRAPGSAPLETNSYLQPFFDKNVNSKLSVLTGLTDAMSDHFYGVTSFLSPCGMKWNRFNSEDHKEPVDLRGPSSDQLAAAYFGQYTAMPFVNLSSFPPEEPINHISWKSATEPASKFWNPRDAFTKLFGAGFDPTEDKAAAARRALYHKSVLDVVKESAGRIRTRLGKTDLQKFDLYLESVRDLELQIERSGAPLSCTAEIGPVPDSNADPSYFQYNLNQDKRLPILFKLLAKAMECDRTRVATLQYTNAGATYMPFIREGQGLPGGSGQHVWSHYLHGVAEESGMQEKFRAAQIAAMKWNLSFLVDLMWRLDQVRDPDGSTALDNSIIYFSGDVADGESHSCTSMPVFLGGRGGRTASSAWAVNAGRHVRFPRMRWMNAYAVDNSIRNQRPGPFTPLVGETTVRDLQWGILKALGVPGVDAAFAPPAIATAPIDLSLV